MAYDALILSRLQFALTIMFHYLFPPLSIGLGWLMVAMEGMYLKTGDKQYEAVARFWTGIFAVVFAMGVATGIVMEFQFGTNWARYSRFVGDVFGSALAAEGIFAFFLESGFLAVLVFGWDRVGKKMHFFSTCMVALGALFSSVWITIANSWQQTPAGYHIVGTGVHARAEITDFWAMVFNPSSVQRLIHVWIGCGILGAFFVLSISSWYILRGRHLEVSKKMFKLALGLGIISSLAAPISGHFQARGVAVNQPPKLAAFEGHFDSKGPAPMHLFGIVDTKTETVRDGVAIPGLLSFLVHDNWKEPVPGLDQVPRADWPPVNLSFQTYHLMVTLGMYFIAVTLLAAFFLWRGTLWRQRWLLWLFVVSVLGAYAANEAGWVAAEVGRQPWIVWKQLRTADAFSTTVPPFQIAMSIVMFMFVYFLLFIVWITVMHTKILKGPEEPEGEGGESFFGVAADMYAPGGPGMTGRKQDASENEDEQS